MSRWPALIPMNMYYVKMSNVYYKGAFHTYEYIATVLGLENIPGNDSETASSYQKLNKICVSLEIHASTQEWDSAEIKRRDLMEITQMNDPSGVSPSRVNCEYYWQKAAYVTFPRVESDSWKDCVFQKFNPKNLPLYINWEHGQDWVCKQLKESTYDKSGRARTAEPALTPQ